MILHGWRFCPKFGPDECHKSSLLHLGWFVLQMINFYSWIQLRVSNYLDDVRIARWENVWFFFGWGVLCFGEACLFGGYGLLLLLICICSPSHRSWSCKWLKWMFLWSRQRKPLVLMLSCAMFCERCSSSDSSSVLSCWCAAQVRTCCLVVELHWFQVNGLWMLFMLIETCEQDHKFYWRRSMIMPIEFVMVYLSEISLLTITDF